jgi:hypothetical protein
MVHVGSRPSPRPRFELRSRLSPDALADRMNRFLREAEDMRGIAFATRIELAITGADHHFWSPQLVAEVTESEGGSRIDARFGPDPYVWAMYVLSYVALGLLALLALAFGASQSIVGETPTAFLALPVLAVLAGLVFGASFVGQGLGSDQMYRLRAKLVELSEPEDDPGPEG